MDILICTRGVRSDRAWIGIDALICTRGAYPGRAWNDIETFVCIEGGVLIFKARVTPQTCVEGCFLIIEARVTAPTGAADAAAFIGGPCYPTKST